MFQKIISITAFCFLSSAALAQNAIELRQNQLKKTGEAQAELKPTEIKAEPDNKSKKADKLEKENLADNKILNDFFELKKTNTVLATDKLKEWQPKKIEEGYYKKFFLAQIENSAMAYWELFKELKKNKKLRRVQLETLKLILENDLLNKEEIKNSKIPLKDFKKETKLMVRRMNSLPEGLDFELKYLNWIRKNQVNTELCYSERNRWLAQTSLELAQISAGLSECPIVFNDFIYRTRMLIFSGEEKKAKAELSDFIKAQNLLNWQIAYLQAIFFSNVGDPISAFKEVKDFENEILASDDYADNLFYIAQRAGELEKAEDLINKIIKQAKTEKEKKEFIFQKAFLFYQTQKYKQAIVLFDDLIKKHPSHKAKRKKSDYDDLTWLKAWCFFLDKNFIEARVEFTTNKAWTRDKAKNLYWLAQSEWALDNQITALEHYKQLAQPLLKGEFFNYYNLLGWLRFENYKSFATSNLLANQLSLLKSGRGPYFLPDDQTNPLRMITEYKTYFEDLSQTDEGDIQIVNQEAAVVSESDSEITIEGSADLKRQIKWAESLSRWGYADLAKWHLFEVEKSLKKRITADPLIQYYIDRSLHNRALSLMQKITSTQQKKISLRDDDLLWKSIYPRAYQVNVSAESENRKISPNLIWSIMKAETQYKQDAISPVGAVGLMQFMPYTSQKVALLIKEQHDLQNLFKPEIAIQYGAAYLKKLSVEFDGQLPLIAAAYNGGPHRVKLWLRNFGEIDFDVFIEHIPFVETRTYVKRVLSFYVTYQKIYDEKIDFKKIKFLTEKNPYQIKEPISLKEEWDIPIR